MRDISSTRQVLVVDDDSMICDLLAEFLEKDGYRPFGCNSGREALALCRTETFVIAFVDINLPDINGLELAAKMKESAPQREVVFITGSGDMENAVQAIRIGAYDYLRKPFSFAEVSLCLKRFEERNTLKQCLRSAEQRYSDLVQSVPVMIYVLRSDYQLEFVNQACSPMLGYTPEEALGAPNWFMDHIHAEDRDRISALLRTNFSSGGSTFSTECRLIHKGGRVINAFLRSIPTTSGRLKAEGSKLTGIIVDITDRVFLEKTLVQNEKLKTLGALSEEVAHEIRNPIVSIGGFARRLKKKSEGLAEIDIILEESQRLERILERLTGYLKTSQVRHEECSVNDIVTECMDFLAPQMSEKDLSIRLELNPDLPAVYVDCDILKRISVSVIRNAARMMEEGTSLTIKSFESDQRVHLEYLIPTHKHVRSPEKLILPFDETDQNLSIALSYRLLKDMGGLLSFAQEKGLAIFTVTLPKEFE